MSVDGGGAPDKDGLCHGAGSVLKLPGLGRLRERFGPGLFRQAPFPTFNFLVMTSSFQISPTINIAVSFVHVDERYGLNLLNLLDQCNVALFVHLIFPHF